MDAPEVMRLPDGTVSLMFTDVEGSTVMARDLGAETFAGLVAEHRTLIRAAVEHHGGIEIDTAGDGFFVVFATARAAVAAAVEIQRSVEDQDWIPGGDIRVRIGIHTGEPHRTQSGYSGIAVHRAARICAAGHGGQVLLSAATAGIVQDESTVDATLVDLGEHSLKGLAGPQRLFQLTVDGLAAEFGPLRTEDVWPTLSAGTFLLTDLAGWSRVVLTLGDTRSAALIAEYQQRVSASVLAHHGVILEQAGDEATSVFAQAGDAISAVDSLRLNLADFAGPPGITVSLSSVIHSGHWSGSARAPEAGTAMYRLRHLAHVVQPGQILVSQATAALLDGTPSHQRLQGLREVTFADSDESMLVHELASPD